MKYSTGLLCVAAALVSVSSLPMKKRDVDPNLVPQFGVTAGVNPDGTGSVNMRSMIEVYIENVIAKILL